LHQDHRALGLAPLSTVACNSVSGAIDIAQGKPVEPVTLVRPHAAARAARFFVEKFPGRSMYAVKANPSPELIQILWENGITHFDVASIGEVRMVARTVPEATLCFMHPVKAEEAIAEAYFKHGVRTFSLDSLEELDKIMRATRNAADLTLCVRLRVSSEHSKLSLASKFGVAPQDAKPLLFAARQAADALGICFHVGSQAMTPEAYSDAMERVRAEISCLRLGEAPQALLRASFGVTDLRPDDRELDDLVARADAALYAAKREGKNRVTVSRAAA
jgi:ornithine decarboxylase